MNLGGTIKLNRYGFILIGGVIFLFIYYHYISSVGVENNRSVTSVNLRQLLIGSVEAAINGGKEVFKISKDGNFNTKSKGKTMEGANDPVTDADYKSNCVMYYGLHTMYPKLVIVSEENSKENECPVKKVLELDPTLLEVEVHNLADKFVPVEDVTVWIDPLDATQEYTEKMFQYVTTMICVAVKGKPTIGVIHFPFTDKTSWVWIGKKASTDLMKVKENMTKENKPPVFIVSRSHAGSVANVTKIAFGDAKVIAAAGAGYKSIQVARGNATAYLHTSIIKKWDICAGNAVLNYLGGSMTTLSNDVIDYSDTAKTINTDGILATLTNHDYYIEKLSKYIKK